MWTKSLHSTNALLRSPRRIPMRFRSVQLTQIAQTYCVGVPWAVEPVDVGTVWGIVVAVAEHAVKSRLIRLKFEMKPYWHCLGTPCLRQQSFTSIPSPVQYWLYTSRSAHTSAPAYCNKDDVSGKSAYFITFHIQNWEKDLATNDMILDWDRYGSLKSKNASSNSSGMNCSKEVRCTLRCAVFCTFSIAKSIVFILTSVSILALS